MGNKKKEEEDLHRREVKQENERKIKRKDDKGKETRTLK